MKQDHQQSSIRFPTYEVTSSLTIPNWLQLAMEQLTYCQIIQKKKQSIKENDDDSNLCVQNHLSESSLNNNDNQLLYHHLKIYQGKVTIDFSNQQSLTALTRCILKVVFGLQWSLPQNNLCPRIPNRFNYIMWIYRYLLKDKQGHSLSKQKEKQIKQKQQIKGIDIGTGASLIYPLIGVKVFGWKFIATQQDQMSLQHAGKLIALNDFQQSIELRKPSSNNLLRGTIKTQQKVNFTICNPPFFDTQSDFSQPLSKMTQSQHNTTGGQYEFFFSLYLQSFYFPNIEWFTMMIGLGRDFEDIKMFLERQLRQYEVLQDIKFGKLNQSQNTRFVVAWKVNKKQINRIAKLND